MIFRWSEVVCFFAALIVVGWLVFPNEYFRGQIHRDEGDRSESIAFYSSFLREHPFHKGAVAALAQAYEDAARPEEAADLLEAFYRHRRGDLEAGQDVLDMLDRADLTARAKAFRWELFTDLKAMPVVDSAQLESLMYDAYQRATAAQDETGAERALQALIDLGIEGGGFRDQMLSRLLAAREFDKALKFLRQEAAARPRDPEILRTIVRVHRFMSDPPGAIASAKDGLETFPTDIGLLSERAAVFLQQKDCAAAAPDLRKLSSLQPANASWPLDLAACLIKLGRFNEGLQAYDDAIRRAPDDKKTWWNAIYTLADRGRRADAASRLERFVKRFPDDAEAVDMLVYEDRLLDRRDAAAEVLRRHLAANPKDAARTRDLASLLVGSSKLDEAAAEYKKLVKLKPDDRQAWEDLISLYKDHQRYAEAAAILEDFLRLHPDDPKGTDYYVSVLRKLGKRRQAVSVLRGYLLRVGTPALFAVDKSTSTGRVALSGANK